MDVLGVDDANGARAEFGQYLAVDGSLGARVAVDVERPHAGVVVGKRGMGKSYTLGVLAEGLATADGVAPVVVDPMGAFGGLEDAGLDVVEPRVRADALPPRAWCRVLNLKPTSPAGTLVWRAADERGSLAGMQTWVTDADATAAARRAASNHLALAASWPCFDADGVECSGVSAGAGVAGDESAFDAAALFEEGAVLDCTRLRGAALRGTVFAVADALYRAALTGDVSALPWLLVDEAHACASGVVADAIETLYTRGRAPGASVVLATQRPSELPEVAVSQSDLVVAHRVTAGADVDALAATRPTYLDGTLASRLPANRGEALVVDDATESACTIRVRERRTEHAGGSARASEVV